MDPKELGNDIHFTKSRKGELLIKFANNDRIEEELRNVRSRLSAMGPEVIKNVTTLSRLDRLFILDTDPSTEENEILDALRSAAPRNLRGMISVTALWQTTSEYAKAISTASRSVGTVRTACSLRSSELR